MKCPYCRAPLPGAVAECPHCGLSMQELDFRFGAVPRHEPFVTDQAGELKPGEIRELRTLLRLFMWKFPQSVFSVFLTNQVPEGAISEYTFWLANRVHFAPSELIEGENFDLLLTVDTVSRSAGLIAGYGLEQYLNEGDLERALAGASGAFHARDFAKAIRVCVQNVMNRLREVEKGLEMKQTIPAPAAGTET
jgi:uncharacterized membrane protein YgcG